MTDLTQAIKAELIRQGGYAIDWTDGGLLKTPIDAVVMGDDSDARYVDLDALAAVVEAHLRPVVATVATVAELDALPQGTVIRDVDGDVYEAWDDGDGIVNYWQAVGYETGPPPTLPATVIYRPAD